MKLQAEADAVICDLDGTLLNTIADIAAAVEPVLAGRGYPGHEVQAYKQFVGHGLKNTLIGALPEGHGLTDDEIDVLYGEMMEHYHAAPYQRTEPYEGIIDFLDTLQAMKIPVGILSNKDHELTVEIVSHILPDHDFSWVQGLQEPFRAKPDPASSFMVAQRMGVSPERILMIGDSEVDHQTAIHAGMIPRVVSWGFRSAEELRKSVEPSMMIDTAKDLIEETLRIVNGN